MSAKLKVWLALLILAPVAAWALYGSLGGRMADMVSSRYGNKILAKSDGKFSDAGIFMRERLRDGAELLTAACLVLLAYHAASRALQKIKAPARWVAQGWMAFLCVNVFAAAAAHTVLFWCLLFAGKDRTINYTQYRIKEGLLRECGAPSQAVLMGASQTRSEMDTKVLNDQIGRTIWTTELHFPGSSPYDMGLCLEKFPKARVNYVITYLSAPNFCRNDNGRLIYFFGLRDVPSYLALGAGKPVFDRFALCGLMGDIFPLYRVWEPLIARARGPQSQNQEQETYDAGLETNLAARAQRIADGMSMGPDWDFRKKAFADFARMCRERGARLIICCGQVNPILEHVMNPALRSDMVAFLRELAAKDSNIVLLEPSQLPPQGENDYEDLTHVNLATRAQFSQFMAGVLEKLADRKPSLSKR